MIDRHTPYNLGFIIDHSVNLTKSMTSKNGKDDVATFDLCMMAHEVISLINKADDWLPT